LVHGSFLFFVFPRSHYAGRNRYEVEDVEEDDTSEIKGQTTRKKYTMSADAIIALPTTLPDPSKKVCCCFAEHPPSVY